MRGGLSSQGAPQSRLGDRACGPRASAAGRSGRREAGGKTAGSRGSEAEHPASIRHTNSASRETSEKCKTQVQNN